MRARLRLLAPLVTAIPLASFACVSTPPVVAESDDGGAFVFDSGGVGTDTGTSPFDGGQSDATLPGNDGGGATGPDGSSSGGDGGAADGANGPDGASDDGAVPTGLVTVVVTSALGPELGAQVVFQDSSGNPLETGTTDASGTVSQVVTAGSDVTAVLGTPANPVLVTIVGVQPGDVLNVVDTSIPAPTTGLSVDVTALPSGAPAETGDFIVSAGACQGSGLKLPISIALGEACGVTGSDVSLLAVADGPSGGGELGYAYQKGVTIQGEEAGVLDVAVGGTWMTATAETVTATNVPSSLDQGVLAFGEIANGSLYSQAALLTDAVANDDGGTPSASFLVHGAFADFLQTEANAVVYPSDTSNSSGQSIIAMAARTAAGAPALSFDFSQALPLIEGDSLAFGNPVQPTLSWTTAAPATSSSGTVSLLVWNGTDEEGGTQLGTWTIVTPPAMAIVQAPALPAALSGWAPTSAEWSPPVVALIGGSLAPAYGVLRANASGLSAFAANLAGNGYPDEAIIPALPANGTLQVSALVEPE